MWAAQIRVMGKKKKRPGGGAAGEQEDDEEAVEVLVEAVGGRLNRKVVAQQLRQAGGDVAR